MNKLYTYALVLGIFASPLFVVDRISSSESTAESKYASKDIIDTIKQDVSDIKKQQNKDHDIIVKMSVKLGVPTE